MCACGVLRILAIHMIILDFYGTASLAACVGRAGYSLPIASRLLRFLRAKIPRKEFFTGAKVNSQNFEFSVFRALELYGLFFAIGYNIKPLNFTNHKILITQTRTNSKFS